MGIKKKLKFVKYFQKNPYNFLKELGSTDEVESCTESFPLRVSHFWKVLLLKSLALRVPHFWKVSLLKILLLEVLLLEVLLLESLILRSLILGKSYYKKVSLLESLSFGKSHSWKILLLENVILRNLRISWRFLCLESLTPREFHTWKFLLLEIRYAWKFVILGNSLILEIRYS